MRKYVLTYGIACIETMDGKTKVIKLIPDVTSDEGTAKKIVSVCNTQDLSPEQLADIVDDLINA